MNRIHIDFLKHIGKIKPMHAVNNMPTVPFDVANMYHYFTEAGIPYARLHDTGGQFGGAHYVDIENIFPDFSADENLAASYDFAFTDALLEAMEKAGVKPFYRLGCTIENYHAIKAYHIYPPKDFEKWARVCEHIIMHYNEGWANGFHYDIEYWEIWNEPDNEPIIADNPMWRGTKEQFFELYDITARYLKQRFPELKIGGYASCGFYALLEADYSEVAHSSSRTEYFVEFFLEFLAYISEHKSPMDFFSWHSYAGLKDNVKFASYVKEKLEAYGYGNTKIIFNEWNPGIHNRGKIIDASNIASMMCALQHTSVDMSMYYDGAIASGYCGLFDPVNFTVFPAYYAFKAYGVLYELGTEVESICEADGCYVVAAVGKADEQAIMIVNTLESVQTVLLEPANEYTGHLVCEEKLWEEEKYAQGRIELPPYAVLLLEK